MLVTLNATESVEFLLWFTFIYVADAVVLSNIHCTWNDPSMTIESVDSILSSTSDSCSAGERDSKPSWILNVIKHKINVYITLQEYINRNKYITYIVYKVFWLSLNA